MGAHKVAEMRMYTMFDAVTKRSSQKFLQEGIDRQFSLADCRNEPGVLSRYVGERVGQAQQGVERPVHRFALGKRRRARHVGRGLKGDPGFHEAGFIPLEIQALKASGPAAANARHRTLAVVIAVEVEIPRAPHASSLPSHFRDVGGHLLTELIPLHMIFSAFPIWPAVPAVFVCLQEVYLQTPDSQEASGARNQKSAPNRSTSRAPLADNRAP
jgi:hypothetical protein